MLTVEELRRILIYEPDTGEWVWLVSPRNNVPTGAPAGHISSTGYRRIKIDDQVYVASRLAFLYMTGRWPNDEIDHINRNQYDDRWKNLREATAAQNMRNRGRRSDNKSGITGVYWRESRQKWCAKVDTIYLGQYDTLEEAVAVRNKFVAKWHGEFTPQVVKG